MFFSSTKKHRYVYLVQYYIFYLNRPLTSLSGHSGDGVEIKKKLYYENTFDIDQQL